MLISTHKLGLSALYWSEWGGQTRDVRLVKREVPRGTVAQLLAPEPTTHSPDGADFKLQHRRTPPGPSPSALNS